MCVYVSVLYHATYCCCVLILLCVCCVVMLLSLGLNDKYDEFVTLGHAAWIVCDVIG